MSKLILIGLIIVVAMLGCSDNKDTALNNNAELTEERELSDDLTQKMIEYQATIEDVDRAIFKMSDEFPPDFAVIDYDVYSVTFLWGDLPGSPGPNLPSTDWSGTLGIENGDGIVEVVHQIDFEHGQDSVIPHNSVHFAAWASTTNGDLDGLSFLVFIQRATTNDAAPFVSFQTAPFELILNQMQLSHYSALHMVSNTQAVAVLSRQIWPNNCPGGFITGQWQKYEIFADSGTFYGTWHDHNSEPVGVMAGTYWTTDDNARLFHAYISHPVLTVVIGEAHGIWMYDDLRLCPMCGAGRGLFHGKYELYETDNEPRQFGKLWGEFGDYSIDLDALNLPMRGIWRADCLHSPHDDGVGSSN